MSGVDFALGYGGINLFGFDPFSKTSTKDDRDIGTYGHQFFGKVFARHVRHGLVCDNEVCR